MKLIAGILSENLNILMSSNYSTVQYFLLKFRTRFVKDFFYFVSILNYLQKLRTRGFYTLAFYIFH